MTPVARFGLIALCSSLCAAGVIWYTKQDGKGATPTPPATQIAAAPAAATTPTLDAPATAATPQATPAPKPPAPPHAVAAPSPFEVTQVAPPDKPIILEHAVKNEGANPLIKLTLDAYGAGMSKLELPAFNPQKGDTTPYILSQTAQDRTNRSLTNGYAATEISVDGTALPLFNQAWSISDQTPTRVTLTASVQNRAGKPVLRIERVWALAADRPYGIDLTQKIVNLDGQDHKISFAQLAQDDVANDGAAYMGDGRKFALGYFSQKKDAGHKTVLTDNGFVDRRAVVTDMAAAEGARDDKYHSLWPWYDIESRADRLQSGNPDTRLAWLGSYNRYFLLATHTPLPKDAKDAGTLATVENLFPTLRTLVKPRLAEAGETPELAQSVQLLMETGTFELKAGQSHDLSLGIYAGPRDANPLEKTPAYAAAGLDQTVRFRLTEGFCGSCSFQWLAHLLLSYLNILHDWVAFHDWGLAIIILVLTVRLMLHPLTKKSQISMMRFGEQMKAIQPELQKVKDKYPGDKEKLSQETMRLYREKGINPANVLGCLPMFLQMPIWAALYAMLYYAFPLRHEAAFWGVFQNFEFGGHVWQFLGDLSSSDRFIVLFSEGQHVIDLKIIQFDYSAINILPLLMAVVMYFNMKYTQTPATTDDQRMQQNMMKVMTLVMFPLMLYSAPCGLTLYITASTLAGIVDSMIVRRHINEMKANGTLLTKTAKAEPKPGTWRYKMAQRWTHIKAVAEAKRDGKPLPLSPQEQEALKKQNPFPRGPQSRWK